MSTLTDRYLAAAAKHLPEPQRAEFRRELAERIADTVDAKLDAGATPATAEYDTLADLGHPSRLAADYADRPLQLIGPRYYLLWWQLLRLLATIVGLASAFGVALAGILDGDQPWEVISTVLQTGLSAVVFVCFGVTLVFAILERQEPDALADVDPATTWTPEDLPEPTTATRETRSERIVEAAWLGVLGVVVLLAQRFSHVTGDDGGLIRLFQPDTWSWLRWALVAIIAAELVLTLVAVARGRRGWWQAAVRVLLNVATCAVLIPPVAAGRLVNPEFPTAAGWADGAALVGRGGAISTTAIVVIAVACLADAIGAVRAAWREERMPA